MFDSFESDLNDYYRAEDSYNERVEQWKFYVDFYSNKIKKIILELVDLYKPYFDEEDEADKFADRIIDYIQEDIVDIVDRFGLDLFEDDILDLIDKRNEQLEKYILDFFEDYDLENQEEFNKVMGY